MVTPLEQKEMVIAYRNKTKDEFAEAFHTKYAGTMSVMKLTGRIRSLWDCRHTHADELARIEKLKSEKNHTVMIPARIISKHEPPRDTVRMWVKFLYEPITCWQNWYSCRKNRLLYSES